MMIFEEQITTSQPLSEYHPENHSILMASRSKEAKTVVGSTATATSAELLNSV